MDNLLRFVRDRQGQRLASAGGLGGQCVDLVEVWWATLGAPSVPGNAVDLWRNAPEASFRRERNGPTNVPGPGAVVIWRPVASEHVGLDGHCALAVAAGPNVLLTFDQGWPPGSPAHLVIHSYSGVVGWLTYVK